MAESDKSIEWLANHFRSFLADATRLRDLNRISTTGIAVLTHMPKINRLIIGAGTAKGIVRAPDDPIATFGEDLTDLASREVADGFPITNSQYLVDIWGLLEACVRKLMALWLEHLDGAMRVDAVSKLKTRIGEYEARRGAEKYYFVVQLLEREYGSSLKSGADRFESLLQCVGLDGPAPKRLKTALYELSQLRNAIVHNARRADTQLVEACPWLNLSPDDPIRPNETQLRVLSRAVMDYAILILARGGRALGEEMDEEIKLTALDWQDDEPRS